MLSYRKSKTRYIHINNNRLVKKIEFLSLNGPHRFYNIDDDFNSFNIIEDAIEFIIKIDSGNYTITDLISKLTAELNAVCQQSYTFIINEITGIITIKGSGTKDFQIKITKYDVGYLLGFDQNTAYDNNDKIGDVPFQISPSFLTLKIFGSDLNNMQYQN